MPAVTVRQQTDTAKPKKEPKNPLLKSQSNNNNSPKLKASQLNDTNDDERKTRERLKAHDKSSVLENQPQYESESGRNVTEKARSMLQQSFRRVHRSSSRNHMSSSALRQVSPSPTTGVLDDSVFYSQACEEVLQTTRGLCRDYICYRLKRSGFQGRVVITKYAPAKDQTLSFEILRIGKTFEDLYPHLFRNLARQLGYVLRSDQELRSLFNRLAISIIGTRPEEYRWGRILALMAVAGSLSVDCIAQGHTELIESMVTVFCDFVSDHLLTWIIEHGGWAEMAKVFGGKKEENEERFQQFVSNLGSAFVPMGWASVLLAGMVLALGAMSQLYSFEI